MIDLYDSKHYETGSSNISKDTPEWKEKLKEARNIYDGSIPVLHIAYQLINDDIINGKTWARCLNCGSPFRATSEFSSICTQQCHLEYLEYLGIDT